MNNPLIPNILSTLHRHPAGISEHDLLTSLERLKCFPATSTDDQLALFQKHFMIMNGLYQLQKKLWQQEQLTLTISPLLIQLFTTVNKTNHSNALSDNSSLSEYYCDWDNYNNTDTEHVNDLLTSFWTRLNNTDKRDDALTILELEQHATLSDITTSYRRLASQHHPDKGGSRQAFIRIRQAYEILKGSKGY